MKNNEYFIVHKSILPEYFEQVIKVRELTSEGKVSVSDACKMENISRSTYYKYKDFIFRTAKNSGSKAYFRIKTQDEKGVLSSILQIVYSASGNVISINQDSPIDGSAFITLAIDASDLSVSLEDLKNNLSILNGIKSIDIVGVE